MTNANLALKKALTFKEGCEYTGITESYMYRLTSAKKVPHSKPRGKMIVFDRDQLDIWMLKNPVATGEQLDAAASTHVTTHQL